MKNTTIKIDKTTYPVKFGYGALRVLKDLWNLKTLGELDGEIAKLAIEPGTDVSFEYLDILGDIILAGIIYGGCDDEEIPKRDAIVEYLLLNPDKSVELVTAFMEAMPQPKQVGKPKPQTKRKTPRK